MSAFIPRTRCGACKSSVVWKLAASRRRTRMLVRMAATMAMLSCAPVFILPPKFRACKPVELSSELKAHSALQRLSTAAGDPPPSAGIGVAPAIVNLFKNIVGSGILALPAGVAAFSSSWLALLPSLAILLAVGVASAYTFLAIARVGAAVGASTYRDTWTQVYGKKSAVFIDLTVIFMTACAGLSYSIIIGDSFASIAKLAGAPEALASANSWIVILSALVLLPLSLLRDLSSLAIGSVAGTVGTVYTALFIFLRLFDGSYAPGGKFHAAIPIAARPAFATPTATRPLINPSIFVLVSMLASAYLAHYNAPKYYAELEAPKDGSSKMPRFNLVVGTAFAAAALLLGSVMAGGFLTFGSSASGFILNNYATSDALAFFARLGIGVSIIFSYPLNFVGLREGVLSMAGKEAAGKKGIVHIGLTVALMLMINGTALFAKDLGLVTGLGGAILGSSLVYIFPALMAVGEKAGAMDKLDKVVNWAFTALGIFFAGLGAKMCLQ